LNLLHVAGAGAGNPPSSPSRASGNRQGAAGACVERELETGPAARYRCGGASGSAEGRVAEVPSRSVEDYDTDSEAVSDSGVIPSTRRGVRDPGASRTATGSDHARTGTGSVSVELSCDDDREGLPFPALAHVRGHREGSARGSPRDTHRHSQTAPDSPDSSRPSRVRVTGNRSQSGSDSESAAWSATLHGDIGSPVSPPGSPGGLLASDLFNHSRAPVTAPPSLMARGRTGSHRVRPSRRAPAVAAFPLFLGTESAAGSLPK
jgi:hypothetical protein